MTRVAVVGLGWIAAEHLEKLNRLEGVEVAGICDLSPTLVEAVSERYRVGPGFTDCGEMLERTGADVVHVLTPPQTRVDLVLAALESGAHVFAEKPIAPDLAGYERLRDAAVERGLLLVENYNYRCMAAVVRALEMVRAGDLGRPVNLDVTFSVGLASAMYSDPEIPHFAHSLPGGAMRNLASHPASIVTQVIDDWERVAVHHRTLKAGFPGTDELRALVAGDSVSAIITITSHAKPARLFITLQGTEASLECDVFAQRLHVDAGSPQTARITNPIRNGVSHLRSSVATVRRATTTREGYFQGFESLLTGFYAAVAGRGESPVTVRDMDATNRLVEDLLAEENRI